MTSVVLCLCCLQTIFEVGLKPGSSAIQVMQQKRSLHGNIVAKEREKRVITNETAEFVAEKPQEINEDDLQVCVCVCVCVCVRVCVRACVRVYILCRNAIMTVLFSVIPSL